jgi:putative membrane protein
MKKNEDNVSNSKLVLRGLVGGVFMGLANLVPGISGGTMLVAAGIYQRFIAAIAEVTTFKFRGRSVLLLGSVVFAAASAILLLAGPTKELVVHQRWIMYAIFIGLTLGGVPVVWTMVDKATRGLWVGASAGFVGMAVLGIVQAAGSSGAASNEGFLIMLFAGMIAAGAMILPGISGGYLFLVMGVYVPVLTAIDELKLAVKGGGGVSGIWGAAQDPVLNVVVPVGIGVVIGVVLVSNLLKIALARAEKPTLGVLLGLLVGAVVGLWPFQQGVAPKLGELFRGQPVTSALLETIKPEKYPTEFFTPSATQVLIALSLIVAGFAVTAAISRLSREDAAS